MFLGFYRNSSWFTLNHTWFRVILREVKVLHVISRPRSRDIAWGESTSRNITPVLEWYCVRCFHLPQYHGYVAVILREVLLPHVISLLRSRDIAWGAFTSRNITPIFGVILREVLSPHAISRLRAGVILREVLSSHVISLLFWSDIAWDESTSRNIAPVLEWLYVSSNWILPRLELVRLQTFKFGLLATPLTRLKWTLWTRTRTGKPPTSTMDLPPLPNPKTLFGI